MLRIYAVFIISFGMLFFQAIQYNKIVSNNNYLKEEGGVNYDREIDEQNNLALSDFKSSILYSGVKVEQLTKKEDKYAASIVFYGNYLDLINYIDELNNKKLTINSFKFEGNYQNVMAKLYLE